MSATAVNAGTARGAKDKRSGYSSLNLNYKSGGRGDSKGYGRYGRKGYCYLTVYCEASKK